MSPVTFGSVFWLCFWPRLLMAVIFTSVGYLGSGGDPQAYHILGAYSAAFVQNPATASLEELITQWWDNSEPFDLKFGHLLLEIQGGGLLQAGNTALPIIAGHAVLYSIWNHPFIWVAVQCVVSAAATSALCAAFKLDRRETLWLAFNPISLYFAGTHYKESLVESAIVTITAVVQARRHYAFAALAMVFLVLFRLPFAGLVLPIFMRSLFAKVDGRLTLVALLGLLLVVPPFYWGGIQGETGPVYALINSNEVTRRILAPLLGLLMPVPFLESLLDGFGVLLTIYGLFYWFLLCALLLHLAVSRYTRPWVVIAVFLSMLIGYYSLGQLTGKARFYAGFLPIMIIAFLSVRQDAAIWLKRRMDERALAAQRI